MKTATQFSLMIALAIISMAGSVQAQGRGHQKGHDKHRADKYEGRHHDNGDYYRKGAKHVYRGHSHHGDKDHRHAKTHHREVRHVYHPHHDRYRPPVVARHYHARPRYIYYRDYDVYYDFHRNVYISYSGRNWTISASLPVVLHRVDIGRAVRMEVDYDQDDFPVYLQTRRPSYRRAFVSNY